MSTELIQVALRSMHRSVSGAESGALVTRDSRDDLDGLYERARARFGDAGSVDPPRLDLIDRYLEAGRQALRTIAIEGTQCTLDARQLVGLEAIIRLTGRPSLLIQDGFVAGLARDSEWYEPLVGAEAAMRQVVASVGRVNLPGSGPLGYVGTAFMVADGLVMTNRHVAERFARPGASNIWTIGSQYPTVDFVQEHQRPSPPPWRVTAVPLVHPTKDLALLRIEPTAECTDGPATLSLGTQSAAITRTRRIYTVGFPASDSNANSRIMREIFGEIFNVKRLAPGEIIKSTQSDGSFSHDCTTLGGNSGSCVVDFGNHRILGLHFGGAYRRRNLAVSLPELTGDESLHKAGVRYE